MLQIRREGYLYYFGKTPPNSLDIRKSIYVILFIPKSHHVKSKQVADHLLGNSLIPPNPRQSYENRHHGG